MQRLIRAPSPLPLSRKRERGYLSRARAPRPYGTMTDKNVRPAEIYVNSSRAVNRGREVWLEVPAEEEVEFEAGFEFVEVSLFCEVEAQDGHVPESDAGAESKGAVEAFEFVVPSGADVEE